MLNLNKSDFYKGLKSMFGLILPKQRLNLNLQEQS